MENITKCCKTPLSSYETALVFTIGTKSEENYDDLVFWIKWKLDETSKIKFFGKKKWNKKIINSLVKMVYFGSFVQIWDWKIEKKQSPFLKRSKKSEKW